MWKNEDELEERLRSFTAGRTTFPTRHEFDGAGRADLRCAVARYGGASYWARRLGLKRSQRQKGREPYLSRDAIHDAKRVMQSEAVLPGARRLRALGYQRLATVVQAAGGARRFVERYGLDSP
jgi:hypothetical protein